MPTANSNLTTTTRRGLCGLGAVLVGFSAAKAAATAKPAKLAPIFEDHPDANLIDLCNDLLAQHAKVEAFGEQRQTIADELRTEAEFNRLCDRQCAIQSEIEKLHPQSFAGAVALAGLLMKVGHKDSDGVLLADSFPEWIGCTLAEFLA